jgi:hypothetical protein
MNTSKHTQGQWVVNKDNSISTNSFDKVLIAQICSANNNEQEQIANAKLIAEAPNMVNFMQLIINRLSDKWESGQASVDESIILERAILLFDSATK